MVPASEISAAMAGDAASKRRLVDAHGPRVWALCKRLDPDPEDAYQAAWERIFERLSRFDPARPTSFASWALTVTHRMLVDRHRRGTVPDHRDGVELLVSDAAGPDRIAERRQGQAQLERALADLPADMRRVVVLHHIHGESLVDIAEREGVAVGTVKSRLHRGRARLAEILGGRDDR